MARVLGLEAMRMADADVLPYDYVAYAREISAYIEAAKRKAADTGLGSLDFDSRRIRRGALCRCRAARPCAPVRSLPAISPS